MKRWFTFFIGLTLILAFSDADARGFRMAMLPNAPGGCNACHTTGGGSPRNSFGLAMEELVTSRGREEFWSPELAALDSDGDGFTNGEELRDPDGDGQPNSSARATRPGSANSFPSSVRISGPRNQAIVVATLSQNGAVLPGATVELSRSIAGRRSAYNWSGTTDDNGRVMIDINVVGRSASGYYHSRVLDADGNVIMRKASIPINGGRKSSLSLAMGGQLASKIGSLGNSPNPFNPATQINYTLESAGVVRLTVFNQLGQEVARLVNDSQAIGNYTVTWDAKDASTGLYFYKLEVDGYSEIGKMLLLK